MVSSGDNSSKSSHRQTKADVFSQRMVMCANTGSAQSLLACPRRSERQPESLCAKGEGGSDGQPAFASDGRFFSIVTKPGCRNGAATWAESSGSGVRSRGSLGVSQSFGLRRQASWLKVWRGGGCKFSATERAHKRNRGQIDAECRLPSLVTIWVVNQNMICGGK
jgi:hypothetical protein